MRESQSQGRTSGTTRRADRVGELAPLEEAATVPANAGPAPHEPPLAIGLLSDRPDPEVAPLAEALGVDFHLGGLSPESKAEAVRSCRRRGLKVVYVGDCRRDQGGGDRTNAGDGG